MKPTILRKRFIPDEIVDISGDELIYRDQSILITRWRAIKLRPDVAGGTSCTFLDKGFKVSRFYDHSGNFLYWYCDIIEVEYDNTTDTYIFKDLLLDIRLYPDGRLNVLDADELAEAMEKGLITSGQACCALRILSSILDMIYKGTFPPEDCAGRLKELYQQKG